MKLSLKQARLMKDMTQREVASSIGVSEHIYRGYEQDPDSVPIRKAKEISKELGLSYNIIFFNSDSNLNKYNP